MKKTKRNVHLIPHTHWDREWYFTSDDSKAMVYWDMKFMIDHLLKNKDAKFLYDGQTSVIDDFLQFSPDWEEKIRKVISTKQLMVGPWYTQTDNLQPSGESILRNLEIGGKIAKDMGHRMKVGYLPDSFGHNPQTPQILRHVGIGNFTFYRGLDPKRTDNKLFFNYESPSGDKVLAAWQTHYTTFENVLDYDGFKKNALIEQKIGNPVDVSIESYKKRTFDLPFWIPIGTDQRPYDPQIIDTATKLNKDNGEFNYKISSYEEMLEEAKEQIEKQGTPLKTLKGELRDALTARVHRSIISARMDLKQMIQNLENQLVNEVEPLALMCSKLGIDIPYKMIEKSWKDVFKSSAHDSYGGCVEDDVYEKIIARLKSASRIATAVSSMLSKIYISKFKEKINRSYEDLFLINPYPEKFVGEYEIKISIPSSKDKRKFAIYDGEEKISYIIVKEEEISTFGKESLTLLIDVKEIPIFSHKQLRIDFEQEGIEKEIYNSDIFENDLFKIQINKGKVDITNKQTNTTRKNAFDFVADPSAGDSYDHSPVTWNDKWYWFRNFKFEEKITNNNITALRLSTSAELPDGLEEWKQNKVNVLQKAELMIILIGGKMLLRINIKNKSNDARMRFLFKSGSKVEKWEHDMQYSVYERKIKDKYFDEWEKEDKYGCKWKEFPTTLSPHQSFINVNDNNYAITTYGSKEHEVINKGGEAWIAVTLYRGFETFGRSNFIYRPGRSSGGRTRTPHAQLIDKELVFKFEIVFGHKSNYELFKKAESFNKRPYILDGNSANERVVLRWNTNHRWYDKQHDKKNIDIKIPNIPKGVVIKALYITPQGENVIRLLNTTSEIITIENNNLYGFNIYDLRRQGKIELKPWKFVSIKI
ncbi:hypothetical protein MYMA111404_02585 [Mycoplasma marinum]|uniref:Glycoside hydrolase family 38 central domain-containing protein n=1 Tax=Mycoplasma marinum TaxID=1937190 RepID=A0A4V2NI52_9MOLU|nr:hypothetical protein [Mycoplasma marinum]TCG11538.1 hypothetical protein C4B24_01675 [Mycoplasma marinum]